MFRNGSNLRHHDLFPPGLTYVGAEFDTFGHPCLFPESEWTRWTKIPRIRRKT